MASRFQAAALVAAPSYPNAIAWSQENLIAVASGHLIAILNPALPSGPRGSVTVQAGERYAIGRVKREDLLSGSLLPAALTRDRRPCVRSISWSPIGMAANSGCLLAICTTEGHVKLYRPPFCDFCAEWIEVIDISDKLYQYLLDTNFGELDIPSSEVSDEQVEKQCCANALLKPCLTKEHKDATSNSCAGMEEKRLPKKVGTKSGKPKKDASDNCTLSLITAEQYAFRSALLSSLVVAWSPLLCLASEKHSVPKSGLPNRFSILAVGGKSGKISIWKISGPQCYSVEHCRIPTCAMLGQLLQAHSSWITTISFAVLGSSSNPQVVLASGSSDGSVKIWQWTSKEVESSEASGFRFSLLKEVLSANPVPVSVLSLAVPVKSPYKVLLAMGKGSGLFEVWTYDILGCAFDKVGSYEAHNYIVTDLAWAFDACCLYSCGQDNYIRGWILDGSSLCEEPLPSNTPGLRSSTELPDVFLSCQGVAVSPGNLVLAAARNPDVDQLNPMYQARAQRAVVEFFWIGGQKLEILSSTSSPDCNDESFPGFSASEMINWETNILWSLKKYENPDMPLVLWDIIAALSAFKQSIPTFVDHLLVKWLSKTFLGSLMDPSINDVLARIHDSFSNIPSRKLHLLNILCRRVILSEFKSDEINCEVNLEGLVCAKGEQFTSWIELLFGSERELRERLVGLSFAAFLSNMSYSMETSWEHGYWYPVGLAQMERWVAVANDHVRNSIKELASEIGKHRRLQQSELGDESCSYCSASVPFNSPEVAVCQGSESVNGVVQNHKLARCAASMQVCPTTPVWLCKCCHRSVSNMAPPALFTMPSSPLDFKPFTEECSLVEEFAKPLCPFCGILLQRLQPEFLPSVSPV